MPLSKHYEKEISAILQIDPLLTPFADRLEERTENFHRVENALLDEKQSLLSFADGDGYFGFHLTHKGYLFREWAPNAAAISLVGDFNEWRSDQYPMHPLSDGVWEIILPRESGLHHGSLVKLCITAKSTGETFYRIPSYIHRVVQEKNSANFNGQVWLPQTPYVWKNTVPLPKKPLLIYECHIGMATEEPKIGSYREFTEHILPMLQKNGYTAVQLMAIMEHPYYASFGYQVTNFFAVSSRFGTPEELKKLIDTAHGMGIRVLLDLVHSHSAVNSYEGLNYFDGSDNQYFHAQNHPAWGTKLFCYEKKEVLHFLLSNVRFWLEEYHFDGFRFDGVTSMLYHDHGLGESFDDYRKYFTDNTDASAVTYLQLANKLIHTLRPDAVTIAEDMSGMPGMALPVEQCGLGFDYRLAMGIPDFWTHLVQQREEAWDIGKMWYEMMIRRPGEKNIGYCESHDQALVGDKTLIFRMADQDMYWHMAYNTRNATVDRAMSLHKIIRLLSFAAAGEGYLNFMGNEFGHPEWIDFPREGNGNSFQYARRQWSLASCSYLLYKYLLAFDNAMLALTKQGFSYQAPPIFLYQSNQNKRLVFRRGQLLFLFNFHSTENFVLSKIQKEKLHPLLHSDWKELGGWSESSAWDVLPPRSALVLRLSPQWKNEAAFSKMDLQKFSIEATEEK